MPEEIKEKKEFLARGEVRTMQKDIERLREEEARKERERIAALKTEEEVRMEREKVERIRREAEERKKIEERGKEIEERKIVGEIKRRAEELERKRIEKKKEEELIKKPIFKKPSLFEKVLVRLAIIIIVLLILANLFLYWYWYLGKPLPFWLPQFLRPPEIEEIIPSEEIPPPEKIAPPEEVIPPEIIIPLSLIPVDSTTTLGISSPEALPTALSDLFKEEFGEGQFTRILIKDITKNEILGLKEFFEAFEIEAPEGFYQKLDNDFTLFIYTIEKRSSLGFITKIIEKEGLKNLLKSWEETMEENFKNLSIALGKEKPARYPDFKEKIYKEITFRYLTITPEPDYFGICYGVFDDYFIYSSSCHNTLKVIDILIK